jgi:hypothetical protein
VSGSGRKEFYAVPEPLKELESELSRLGITRPRLATQLMVTTRINARFEITGLAQLDSPCRAALAGTVTELEEAYLLDATFLATPLGTGHVPAPAPSPVASLKNQVVLRLERPVILAASASDDWSSVLVARLERSRPSSQRVKTASLEFRDASWQRVLEWLSDFSGLYFTGTPPSGRFTFVSPRGAKPYTVAEIIDILNEALLQQKLLLIRRELSFTIVPADARMEPMRLLQLPIESLPEYGKTEMASVMLKLHALAAEDIASEVKKKIAGPCGEVIALKKSNQLLLTDMVGNLRVMSKTIEEVDRREIRTGKVRQ